MTAEDMKRKADEVRMKSEKLEREIDADQIRDAVKWIQLITPKKLHSADGRELWAKIAEDIRDVADKWSHELNMLELG